MRNQLILVLIVIAFHLKYVNTNACYVCNSVDSDNCAVFAAKSGQYVKSCTHKADHRFQTYHGLTTNGTIDGNATFGYSFELLGAYKTKRHSLCLKLVFTVEGKPKRVVGDCGGLVSKGGDDRMNGRHSDARLASEACLSGDNECNSSHRRVHQNHFWLNIAISVIISIKYFFNFA